MFGGVVVCFGFYGRDRVSECRRVWPGTVAKLFDCLDYKLMPPRPPSSMCSPGYPFLDGIFHSLAATGHFHRRASPRP